MSWWILPAVTFLVGLGVGMLILGAVRSSSGSISSATPTVTTTVTATPTGSAATGGTAVATARVPAECLQVDNDARRLVDLANQAVTAAGSLDAARLSDLVRQIGETQKTLSAHAETCRAASATVTTAPPVTTRASDPAGSATVTGSTTAPTP
jgi:hypothetical protein